MSLPADPWHGTRILYLRPRRRWLQRVGCVLGAALLFSAYGTGVSWGHWSLAARADAAVGTGSLGLNVSEPPGFSFACAPQTLPGQGISFVRFWDPLQEPGELEPARSGAVKIEGDGNELGQGPYWVEPSGAAVGDPMTVHVGDVIVQITSWMEKPGEPGEWVAFNYVVSPPEAVVVVDVKAGQSLTRWALSGSGTWTAEGLIAGDGGGACVCEPASQTARLDFANTGSIPAAASLQWILGPSADPAQCGLLEVLIKDGPSDATLFQGTLCDLVGSSLPVSPQLDAGGSTWLDITVSVYPGACPSGDVTLPLVSQATFWQWSSDPPGSPSFFGWSGSIEGPFQIQLSLVTPSGSSAGAVAGLQVIEGAAPLPGEATTTGTTEPPKETTTSAEPPEETTAPVPPEETTTTTPTDVGSAVLPPEETTTSTSSVPEEITTTPATMPLPEEPVTVTLRGRVWEDLDGDGVTVVGQPTAGAGGGECRGGSAGGGRHQWLASAGTGTDRGLRVWGSLPGNYRVEFRAPEGFGFRDPRGDHRRHPATGRPGPRPRGAGGGGRPGSGAGARRGRTGTGRDRGVRARCRSPKSAATPTASPTLPWSACPTPRRKAGEPPAPPGDESAPGDLQGSPTDPNTQAVADRGARVGADGRGRP